MVDKDTPRVQFMTGPISAALKALFAPDAPPVPPQQDGLRHFQWLPVKGESGRPVTACMDAIFTRASVQRQH